MKTFKVEVPNGYEIDRNNSTFENIVFKEIKKDLPRTWEELGGVSGSYVSAQSEVVIEPNVILDASGRNKNIFATTEMAEASVALAQLSQLRDAYRQGWVPDWTSSTQVKHCIDLLQNEPAASTIFIRGTFLSFQSPEIRNMFYENFKGLILKARPLMI
jgi:hypothetical protein